MDDLRRGSIVPLTDLNQQQMIRNTLQTTQEATFAVLMPNPQQHDMPVPPRNRLLRLPGWVLRYRSARDYRGQLEQAVNEALKGMLYTTRAVRGTGGLPDKALLPTSRAKRTAKSRRPAQAARVWALASRPTRVKTQQPKSKTRIGGHE